MPCFRPLEGWRSSSRSPNGKRPVVFKMREGFHDRPVKVPCGQCIGCRLEKSRQWAMRCMHEASQHEENSFVTLTYAPEHIPAYGSLCKADLQKFMKRLRKARYGNGPGRIRYFGSGEYGDRTHRPHYHLLLFGCGFGDKSHLTSRGNYQVYTSPELERLWPLGLHEIGSVTFDSAAYVARYVVKKATGDQAEAKYQVIDEDTGEVVKIQPEFAVMSRRPAVGRQWLEKFGDEVLTHDSVVINGREVKPPKYYDYRFECEGVEGLELVKARRRAKARKYEHDNVPERLAAKEAVATARLNLKGRTL